MSAPGVRPPRGEWGKGGGGDYVPGMQDVQIGLKQTDPVLLMAPLGGSSVDEHTTCADIQTGRKWEERRQKKQRKKKKKER